MRFLTFLFIFCIATFSTNIQAQTQKDHLKAMPISIGIGVDAGATKLNSTFPLDVQSRGSFGLSLNFAYVVGSRSELFADGFGQVGLFQIAEISNPNHKFRYLNLGSRIGFSWDLGTKRNIKLGPFVGVSMVFGPDGLDSRQFCDPNNEFNCISDDEIYGGLLPDVSPGVRLGFSVKNMLIGALVSRSVVNLYAGEDYRIGNTYFQAFANYYFLGNTTETKKPNKKYNW